MNVPSNTAPTTPKVKTVGFGHAEDREAHHFVVAVPRSPQGEVMVYEVFSEDCEVFRLR